MELILRLKKLRLAAKILRLSSVETRNKVLIQAAQLLVDNEKEILKANAQDLKSLPATTTPAFRDRLTLTSDRINHMAVSLRQVAVLPDPLASTANEQTLRNGLLLKKVRSPLGVIFMIFESRPNVAVEAFSMGFKSGNTMILRGGKESLRTTKVLYKIIHQAIESADLPASVLWGITDSDRALVSNLLKQKEWIDVVVPRGGEGLIQFVVKNSHIPIIKNDRGLCHVYVHDDANLVTSAEVLLNAKTHRPGVCNSMETMLIHRDVAAELIPLVYNKMLDFNVKWYGCSETLKILKKTGAKNIHAALKKSWDTEYLDQIVNCKVVSNIEEAIAHIEQHSSRHSESIMTTNHQTARRFQAEIDSAVVYWNASTRFTDGFEFGLGGELGISTQKLHVRGPVGLAALTNERWVVDGDGQIRS